MTSELQLLNKESTSMSNLVDETFIAIFSIKKDNFYGEKPTNTKHCYGISDKLKKLSKDDLKEYKNVLFEELYGMCVDNLYNEHKIFFNDFYDHINEKIILEYILYVVSKPNVIDGKDTYSFIDFLISLSQEELINILKILKTYNKFRNYPLKHDIFNPIFLFLINTSYIHL